ncbi:MAG TPA: BTAD domain-containing putative transcriptional regulator [Chloroflexota bacterium]|nr:BTAD domain-containing putative transcriptional regulator [Chloroflexota bacterium]
MAVLTAPPGRTRSRKRAPARDRTPPPPAAITKVLLPRRRPGTVQRRHLLDFLHRHLDRRLQLVIAPPGYGKTSLLVDFAHEAREQGLPVCWLTLDASDADARSFFEHLLLSLRQAFPGFGERTAALLRAVDDAARDHRTVATSLANELAEQVDEFFLLVLDDYHTVGGATAVNGAVDWLLTRLPEGCRVILGGRTIPTQLNLSALAARLEVAGLGVADLRFTADEVAELTLARDGHGLHPREAERAVSRAEGWVTAILLSLHANESARFSGLLRAKAQREPVYGYLATQVFDHLPDELQRFLTESAILPALSAVECDAVLERDDSGLRLAELVQQSLFVEPLEPSAGGEGSDGSEAAAGWLRYHQLWRAFLLDRLLTDAPQRAATLRRRAAARAQERGQPDLAIDHLLELGTIHGEWDAAAGFILALARGEVAHGRSARLVSWIDRLPAAVVDAEPYLHYFAARALRQVGQVKDAAARARQCEEAATATRRWDVLYLARAFRAQMLAFLGQGEAAVALVVELFDHFNRQPRAEEVRVRLEYDACVTLGIAGRYREAIARGQAVLAQQRHVKDVAERRQLVAYAHTALGNCHAYLGALAEAEASYRAAERLWRQLGNAAAQAGVFVGIGRLHARTGAYAEAAAAFNRGIELADGVGLVRLQVQLRNNLARMLRERGAAREAAATIERALPLARQLDEAYLLAEALEESGHIALQLGHNVEAMHSLEAAQDVAQEHWRSGLALCQALLALAYARSGRLGDARQVLLAAEQSVALVRAPEDRLRTSVAVSAARAAAGSPTAVAELRATRRWARDNERQEAFFAECARYGETARLLLGERRLPDAVVAALQAVLADDPPEPVATPAPVFRMLRAVPRLPVDTTFEIRLFGAPVLLREGENVTAWRTNLVRELLFFLAYRSGSVVRTEAIVDALMPDGDYDRSLTALRHAVYHLRRLFAPLNPVLTATGGYRMDLEEGIGCDVHEFRRLVELGRSVRGTLDVQALESALALYRGQFLEGIDADWVVQPRAELERLFLFAAQKLLDEYERSRRHEAAVAVAERVLAVDPFHEPFHVALMRHQVALGQVAAARQHYGHYCRLMRDAFGRGPDPAATSLLSLSHTAG